MYIYVFCKNIINFHQIFSIHLFLLLATRRRGISSPVHLKINTIKRILSFIIIIFKSKNNANQKKIMQG